MSLVAQYILPSLLLVAAINDVKTHKIPNWISVALLIGFLLFSLFDGLSLTTIAIHMGVGLSVLMCGFILFAFNIIGGGDAKLLASAAIWMGPAAALPFGFLTVFAGGIFSFAVIIFRRVPLPATAFKFDWVMRLHMDGGGIPYGVAIAIGGIATLLMSNAHPYTLY